ncbi:MULTISPECIES: ATP-binding protein [unclassified Endozoicomonas]|uniref:sensor histidine kinase n=1 Tax=unclassified Endozoicomonas TaxID=2644528 RepID=UPI002147ABA2
MSKYLVSVLEADLFSTPWPVFINDHFIPGDKYITPDICESCHVRDCLDSDTYQYICKKNVVSYMQKSGEDKIILIGFQGKNQKKSKLNKFSSETYNQWITRVKKLNSQFEEESLKRMSETLHYFHDPVKWVEQIKISSEKLILSLPGDNFKKKLENAKNEQKALYQSSRMLADSIQMLGVFFNPASASYGSSVKTNVYKLFDKVQAIIYFSEGKKYNKKFNLTGTSFKEIFLYESFPIIALTLIHNALKYSKTREVEINIEDVRDGVEVKVTSQGPVISEEDKEFIFHKGYRGKHANRLHHDGMGIGLYVSQHIAQAHNFEIHVNSTEKGYTSGGIDIAENSFFFTVPANGV